MNLNEETQRGLTMLLMNNNLAVFIMTYFNFSTHVGKEGLILTKEFYSVL
jgi:hypothetical protein